MAEHRVFPPRPIPDRPLDTQFPSPETPNFNSIKKNGFKITTRKLPILKAGPIDAMTNKLGIAPPEMIFGDNLVSIEHPQSGWGIKFNAFDALDRVDKTGQCALKVAYSREWQKSREKTHEGIKEVVKPFDWSYTTDYKGTVTSNGNEFEPSTTPLPLDRLKRPDPILFFDDVMLYEDELADNGISMLSCKIRVLHAARQRSLPPQGYQDLHRLNSREVIREYTSKEESYDAVRQTLAATREDVPAMMRDPNKLTEIIPLVASSLEKVVLPE
ncbi:hypothetical protein CISG_08143 [Coccidioides immitis RMSCC 3703]|uniref:Uncharacterized protein n=1 Tax=Coccidioides immitis RMSCC 3703 TaxID=454286 RepID=A0A0J8R8A4_COCIT|nr:hypothetical protein CISG_08143 [Coccidioides immitis RMSCC 3703]